jgi:hypothetical protein
MLLKWLDIYVELRKSHATMCHCLVLRVRWEYKAYSRLLSKIPFDDSVIRSMNSRCNIGEQLVYDAWSVRSRSTRLHHPRL